MLANKTHKAIYSCPSLRQKKGRGSFYVFLSDHRHEIFNDEDFSFLFARIMAVKTFPQVYWQVPCFSNRMTEYRIKKQPTAQNWINAGR